MNAKSHIQRAGWRVGMGIVLAAALSAPAGADVIETTPSIPLSDDLKGLWAVTVQANWRVTFRFENGDAYVVDYQDYH